MKIILLKDVQKIGKRYETKEVSDGFAANSLIPRKLAIPATPDAVKRISLEIAREAGEKKVQDALVAKQLSDLKGKTITFAGKTNEKGHLFAGLHAKEIAELVQLKADHIVLAKPIKEIGKHPIKVVIGEHSSEFTLEIVSK